jgi:hypothetical protein
VSVRRRHTPSGSAVYKHDYPAMSNNRNYELPGSFPHL